MEKPKLIFIVDDDQFIKTLVTTRFTTNGHKVEAFGCGEDCIKALERNPDLIILDYNFINTDRKVMNGVEVFDKIRDAKPDIPVIMLSGQEKGEIVLELARKGIEDYVIKDNNLIENLKTAVEEIFEN